MFEVFQNRKKGSYGLWEEYERHDFYDFFDYLCTKEEGKKASKSQNFISVKYAIFKFGEVHWK